MEQSNRKEVAVNGRSSLIIKSFLTSLSFALCLAVAPSFSQEVRVVVVPLDDGFFVIPISAPPEQPDTIDAVQGSDNNATISWTPVDGAEYYELQWFNPDTGEWETIYSGSATSFNATNLLYGQNRFRVRACSGNRCGSFGVQESISIQLKGDTGANSVGVLDGEGGVSGGAAQYRIPIAIPPGRKGIQPNISLDYSSRSGSGIAGVGWSLSASSSISRCSASVAQDGMIASVQYSAINDRLCLNGQRLMVVSGAYGASGAEYRTELDQFARIIQNGGINGGSTSFTVEQKDGMTGYYGISASTRHKDAGRSQTMSWAITRSQDRSGNSMHYDYTTFGEGEHLLSAIHYTGINTTQGNRHIRFVYENRPAPTTRFLAGGKSRQTKRLKRIDTQYISETIRQYTLNYGNVSDSSQRSLLRSVQVCAFQNGSANCFPATNFEWQEKAQQFAFERLQFKNSSGVNQVVHADTRWIDDVMPRGDVNGDGVRDWPGFYVNAEGEQTGTHSNPISNCFRKANSWTTSCLEADFDSDGRTDSFRRLNNVLQIKYASSSSWINTGISWPASNQSYPIGFNDFNGDGVLDIAFREGIFSQTANLWIYTHTKNNNAPFNTSNRTLVATSPYSSIGNNYTREYQIHGDVDGNGYADFIEFDTGVNSGRPIGLPYPTRILKVSVNTAGSISFSDLNFTGYLNTQSVNANFFHDVNGDGLNDWLAMANTSGLIHYKLNTGNGFDTTWRNLGLTLPVRFGLFPRQNGAEPEVYLYPEMSKVLTMDYNGDGKQDVLVADTVLASSCTLVQQAPPAGAEWLCDDELYSTYRNRQFSQYEADINSSITDNSVRNYKAFNFIESTSGSISVVEKATNITASASQVAVLDATGDGLQDVVTVFGCRFPQGCEWNGQTGSRPGTVQDGSVVAGAYINRNLGASNGSSRYEGHDMMSAVENGFGVRNEWVYRPLSSDEYDVPNSDFYDVTHSLQGSDPDYFHFASSMYVVAEQQASNGIGGLNRTKYRYRGAIYNNKGRGFQGFKTLITESDVYGSDLDNRDTVSRTDFNQKWPLSGIPTQSCTWLANDGSSSYANDNPTCSGVLSKSVTNEIHNVATLGGARFVTAKKITNTQNKLANRSLLSSTVSETSYDSAGNQTLERNTYEDDYTKTVTQTDRVYAIDLSSWWLNRLSSQTLTKNPVAKRHSSSPSISSGTDGLKKVTTVFSGYNTTHRLPTQVTSSGNDTSLNRVVSTAYNTAGLASTVTTTATLAVGPRTVTNTYSENGSATPSDYGYFVRSIKNPLGHESKVTTNPRTGKVASQTDINGLTTFVAHDAFGRVKDVDDPGLPVAMTRFRSCVLSCPPNAAYKVTTVRVGSPEIIRYKDVFNRDVWVGTKNFSNRGFNATTSVYDELGQKTLESIPYNSANSFPLSTEFSSSNPDLTEVLKRSTGTIYGPYDALGRIQFKRVAQADGKLFTTSYVYDGFKTSIVASGNRIVDGATTPVTMNLHRIRNGLDQLMETKDARNGFTRYAYDGAGNPIVMQDALNNSIIANYNSLGQKLWVDDPNMGRTNYTYNGLSETLSQTDANNDSISYVHDELSRLTERRSNGVVNAIMSYDNPASNKGLGLLDFEDSGAQADGSRLIKSYEYTPVSAGRKSRAKLNYRIFSDSTSFDDYAIGTEYDSVYGRVKDLTYPTGLKISYSYNYNGFLTRETNSANNHVFSQVDAMDVRNKVTQAKLINGALASTIEYVPETGQMRSIEVKKAADLRHSLEYIYDDFGDLSVRKTVRNIDRSEESFNYDKLHRMTTSKRHYTPAVSVGPNPDDVVNYNYDAVGNFTLKSDYANQYNYAPNRPNAVASAALINGAGTISFGYDDNGNMISSGSRTIDYNVFNKPVSIIAGNNQTEFSYGADTKRYKKVVSDSSGTATTLYIDKLMEVIQRGSETKSLAYVGNSAIVIESKVGNAAQPTLTRYLLKGRLGSTVTIADQNGDVLEANGFDPFGKPRTGLWKDKAPATLDSNVTTRGFTGHEHLDEVELIHMNGRAYDYQLGRFLSVDPEIQDPGNSQSMNPYSYILNNPLSGIDPTGYKREEEVKIVERRESIPGSRLTKASGVFDVKVGGKTVASGTVTQLTALVKGANGASQNQGASASGGAVSGDSSVSGLMSISGYDRSAIVPVARGLNAGTTALARGTSDEARRLAKETIDPTNRSVKYQLISKEFAASFPGSSIWYDAATDVVKSIDTGFEGKSAMASIHFMGPSSDANAVMLTVSAQLSAYNYDNYVQLRDIGSIEGLEGLRGRDLALGMGAFEQQVAQVLLDNELSKHSNSAAIIDNINRRFNGPLDRFFGGAIPHLSESIGQLNKLFPDHDFDFSRLEDRKTLEEGIIKSRFNE